MSRYPDTSERLVLAQTCECCPDLVACHNPISWGVGLRDVSAVVVGEAIGAGTRDGSLGLVLDPVECPALDVTAVPLLHPSYRDVWGSRPGHTNNADEQQVETVLAEVTG